MLRMNKAIEGKTRDEVIAMMIRLANEAINRDNGLIENVIWAISSEWNSTHSEREEIAMYEFQSEDSECVNGFMIEDDFWIYKAE